MYGVAGLVVGLIVSGASHWFPRRRLGQRASFKLLVQALDRRDAWVIIATGALFTALWARYGPSFHLVVTSMYTAIFLLIFVIDVAHRWVPNVLLAWATLLALIISVITGQPPLNEALLGGVVGFGWFYLIALVYPDGLGAGDVKLAGLVGLVTGFPGVVAALTVGVLIGGLVAGLLLVTGRVGRKSYIPYAPFLVTGAWVDLVFGAELLGRYSALWAR
jgi:prepilin signal peptidase PulO-like enzyme (type II secretory pathway)